MKTDCFTHILRLISDICFVCVCVCVCAISKLRTLYETAYYQEYAVNCA
jgi:hypothetical protein